MVASIVVVGSSVTTGSSGRILCAAYLHQLTKKDVSVDSVLCDMTLYRSVIYLPTFRTDMSTSRCPFEDGSTALLRNVGDYSAIDPAPFPMRIILRNVAVRTASVADTSTLLTGKVDTVFNLEPRLEDM